MQPGKSLEPVILKHELSILQMLSRYYGILWLKQCSGLLDIVTILQKQIKEMNRPGVNQKWRKVNSYELGVEGSVI
jgi:hypothetical protein